MSEQEKKKIVTDKDTMLNNPSKQTLVGDYDYLCSPFRITNHYFM